MIKELPKPVLKLKKEAQQFYDQVGEYLIENDIMHKVDSMLVLQAASWWQVYIDNARLVSDGDMIMEYESGAKQVHPAVTNMVKAQTSLNVLFKKLGIGEEARQKLNIMEGKPDEDPMDNL